MSALRNCRRCGKLYVYSGTPLCRSCMEEDEEIYKVVREYIEQHPRSTTFEVADALNISVDKILQFLREGKLELSDANINMVLDCEKCGKPIRSGRFCPECATAMERNIVGRYGRVYSDPGSRDKDQMYTAHRRKRR